MFKNLLTKGVQVMSKIFDQFIKNGWIPVSYKHHPEHIKEAISLANFRPQIKQCFSNCQKIVVNQNKHKLRYVEGIVASMIPIEHAWIIDENDVFHDITLNPAPKILCYKVYSLKEVVENMHKTGCYTTLDQNYLNIMNRAILFGIDINLPFQEIEKQVFKNFETLSNMQKDLTKTINNF